MWIQTLVFCRRISEKNKNASLSRTPLVGEHRGLDIFCNEKEKAPITNFQNLKRPLKVVSVIFCRSVRPGGTMAPQPAVGVDPRRHRRDPAPAALPPPRTRLGDARAQLPRHRGVLHARRGRSHLVSFLSSGLWCLGHQRPLHLIQLHTSQGIGRAHFQLARTGLSVIKCLFISQGSGHAISEAVRHSHEHRLLLHNGQQGEFKHDSMKPDLRQNDRVCVRVSISPFV